VKGRTHPSGYSRKPHQSGGVASALEPTAEIELGPPCPLASRTLPARWAFPRARWTAPFTPSPSRRHERTHREKPYIDDAAQRNIPVVCVVTDARAPAVSQRDPLPRTPPALSSASSCRAVTPAAGRPHSSPAGCRRTNMRKSCAASSPAWTRSVDRSGSARSSRGMTMSGRAISRHWVSFAPIPISRASTSATVNSPRCCTRQNRRAGCRSSPW
jgi:hypothetical protein